MAAVETVVRVTRKMFPPTHQGKVETKGKDFSRDIFIPDEVRWNLGGDREGWFNVTKDGDKIVFKNRIPKPFDWDWVDDYFAY